MIININFVCDLAESTNWPPMPGGPGSAKKLRKRSRWGAGEVEKTYIPGMPTVIPPGMDPQQEEQYLCKY